ncbi:serine/threonine-protein kinase [Spirulina major]|uniref:serine/threonine-protein kinase n=1 Tax=Spirulina major TaxID=270636 RepID=UPI0009324282|nr:serine/threonine-protein kinase [Spirulina major]
MSNDYKYSLKPAIGQGIFATTYPAIEVNSNRPVMVKTLAASLGDHEQFGQFRKQVLSLTKKLATCTHPHLPSIWESFTEDGYPYWVSDRILGPTLLDKINADGPIEPVQAVRWCEQIGGAIDALHRAGLKHLDLQPHNLIYRPDTRDVMVVDVGITSDLTPELRRTHATMLAPGYAAPEQYQPKGALSAQADLYSLGAVLYFLLTGTNPPPAPLLDHISIQDWPEWPEAVPLPLRAAIFAALNPDPKQRPRHVSPWLHQLQQAIAPPPPPLDELEATEPPPAIAPVITSPRQTPPAPVPQGTIAVKKVTVKKEATPKTAQKPPSRQPRPAKTKRLTPQFPVGALMMTSVIAASAGAGFGLSLRLNRPSEAGSTFWHVEQSFPPHDQSDDAETND